MATLLLPQALLPRTHPPNHAPSPPRKRNSSPKVLMAQTITTNSWSDFGTRSARWRTPGNSTEDPGIIFANCFQFYSPAITSLLHGGRMPCRAKHDNYIYRLSLGNGVPRSASLSASMDLTLPPGQQKKINEDSPAPSWR